MVAPNLSNFSFAKHRGRNASVHKKMQTKKKKPVAIAPPPASPSEEPIPPMPMARSLGGYGTGLFLVVLCLMAKDIKI